MTIPIIDSAKRIEQQFRTGEEPVLVMCSDVNLYVCKYMHSSATAYKLACELIGARMAEAWQLNTPDIALVRRMQPSKQLPTVLKWYFAKVSNGPVYRSIIL